MDQEVSHTARAPPCEPVHPNALSLVQKWSTRRDPASVNYECFAEELSRTLQTWTVAYQWASVNRVILEEDDCKDDYMRYYVASSTCTKKLTQKLLQQYLQKIGRWRSFDKFKEYRCKIWGVIIDERKIS